MLRAGFGLLSLLIVVAIIFAVSIGTKNHPGIDSVALEKGREAQKQVQQIAGKTEDNVPISDTIKLDEVDSGGQFKRLKVLSITPGTPMDTCYGLQVGDEITRIGDMGVADNNDAGLAKALVYEAYGRMQTLTVLRNDQDIILKPQGTPMSKLLPGQGLPVH